MAMMRRLPSLAGAPLLAQLAEHWDGLAGAGRVPHKRDLKFEAIWYAMPQTVLFEAEGDAERFRFRLAGTAVEEALGLPLRGKWVDEVLVGEYLDLTLAALVEMLAAPEPRMYRNRIRIGLEEIAYDRLLLPFADLDGDIRYVTSSGEWPRLLREFIGGHPSRMITELHHERIA